MPLFSDPSVGIADPLLRRAYVLAERGRGTVSPNPLVGCVVARDGSPIAEGYHERAGGPHAEVVALDAAGEAARGADVFVTLEPCDHHGRTPPCVDRLLRAGVRSVTIGMLDPNIAVSGGGAAALEAAGVRVVCAADPAPFHEQNEAWLHRMRTGRPFVRAKVASTLDGRVARDRGRPWRISGDAASILTMRLRAEATAVAVGAGTVVADDPLLTVRGDGDAETLRQPARYVLARTTCPSVESRVFTAGERPARLVVSDAAAPEVVEPARAAGIEVLEYRAETGLAGALAAIADDGVDDVLVEPGPGLLSALWGFGLVDELVEIRGGGMGGDTALAMYQGPADGDDSALRPRMWPAEVAVVGRDVVTAWRPPAVRADGAERGV